jgi:hypothetical protein
MTKPGFRVVLWACTAVAVTVAASLAIAASVGARGSALSREDVERELAQESGAPTFVTSTAAPSPRTTSTTTPDPLSTTAPPTGGPTGGAGGTTPPAAGVPAAPGPGSVDHVGTGAYGSVVVRCEGGVATLLSWSPSPGYRADDPVRGPAATVSVRFESDVAQDLIVSASCAGTTASISTAPDDHSGGGRGPG